jgi:RNA polymerase sigma-70 factor (ECF subfamily)
VKSVTEVYYEHVDFVWRNARRLGVHESSADDVVQEVFIVVQRRLPDYDGRASMRSWIFGILAHVVHHYHRGFRRKEAPCVSLEQDDTHAVLKSIAEEATPVARLEGAELARVLERLLSELDEEKRTVLVLSELEEWTLREIAQSQGTNINTVYSRLRAAKRDFERVYSRWLAGEEGEVP